MADRAKSAPSLARQLVKLSVVNGEVSAERVAGVLEYLEKHRPAHPLAVLRAYHRLVAAQVARNQAVVEHAGAAPETAIGAIAAALTKAAGRRITAIAHPDPSLIAGLRIRLGDDVYECSVAGQLAALASSV